MDALLNITDKLRLATVLLALSVEVFIVSEIPRVGFRQSRGQT